jgi:hypothetical protein
LHPVINKLTYLYLTFPHCESSAQIQQQPKGENSAQVLLEAAKALAVKNAKAAPVLPQVMVTPAAVGGPVRGDAECDVDPLVGEPWVGAFQEFSAPRAPPEAFPRRKGGKDVIHGQPGFLGKAMGSVHDPKTLKFWKKTFEEDVYVENILHEGYKISVACPRKKQADATGRRTLRAHALRWNLSS